MDNNFSSNTQFLLETENNPMKNLSVAQKLIRTIVSTFAEVHVLGGKLVP